VAANWGCRPLKIDLPAGIGGIESPEAQKITITLPASLMVSRGILVEASDTP
jgi:hypothetical protein